MPRFPFGNHSEIYAAGSISPDVSQFQLDSETIRFYEQWKNMYLVRSCGEKGFFINAGTQSEPVSFSEGHGYGMIIFATMAGYDSEAQIIFDGLFSFFRNHPSGGNPNLMAWRQLGGCSSPIDPPPSATDGDLDIAFALLLAFQQWGNDGPIRYLNEAKTMASAILESEVNPEEHTVLLGDWVSNKNPRFFNAGRSSDFMPQHFNAFAHYSDSIRWQTITDKSYQVLENFQNLFSPDTGLVSDFIENVSTNLIPANPDFIDGELSNQFSANACRIPWRIATGFLMHGDLRALHIVQNINQWIQIKTGGKPEEIVDGYTMQGLPLKTYGDMSFIAPLAVSAMVHQTNQLWLNALWNLVTQTPLSKGGGYYGNTLKMLDLLTLSKNSWSPVHGI